jgi:predicted secreted hydrolase
VKETKRPYVILKLFISLIIVAAGGFTLAQEESEYLVVDGPCNLEFPADHGPHPGYRTEWWYYTGNLKSAKGKRFGFQFTIFRTQISPPGFEKKWSQPPSPWRTRDVYIGHAAITDLSAKHHVQAEVISRSALGLAAGNQNEAVTNIFIRNWSLQIDPDRHTLKVVAPDFVYELHLVPEKQPVVHGETGYIRRGPDPEQASCYYSFTRLKTSGTISLKEEKASVKGLSWMDHEFSTAPLDQGLAGWDWFSLQLSDNTDVMLYLLREKNGVIHPVSSGSWVDADGTRRHLRQDDFEVDILETWQSPKSNAVYPARWQVRIPPLSLVIDISPAMSDQEMLTYRTTGVIYWEGSVSFAGTKNGLPITGQGFVELTGYARPFDAPK